MSPTLTSINMRLRPLVHLRFAITAPVRLADIVGFVSLLILLQLMRVETCFYLVLVSVVRLGSLLSLLLHSNVVELTIISPWPCETRSLLLLLLSGRPLCARTRIQRLVLLVLLLRCSCFVSDIRDFHIYLWPHLFTNCLS